MAEKVKTRFAIYLQSCEDMKTLYNYDSQGLSEMDLTLDINTGTRVHGYIVFLKNNMQYLKDNSHRVSMTGLRDLMNGLIKTIELLIGELDIYLKTEVFPVHIKTTVPELLVGIVYPDHHVDLQRIIELRRLRGVNMYEYVRDMKSKLYDIEDHLTCPLDRYGLICKTVKTASEIFGNIPALQSAKTSEEIFRVLQKYMDTAAVNIIIIHNSNGRRGFTFSMPVMKAEDSWKIINEDFVKRLTTIQEYTPVRAGAVGTSCSYGDLVALPKPGSLCSIYETFDYKHFSFMTIGLDENLTTWERAIGYALANGVKLPEEAYSRAVPKMTHVGFNDHVNEIFATGWHRPDLVVNSAGYKFGETQVAPLKEYIKTHMVAYAEKHPTDPRSIDLREIITNGIKEQLKSGTTESKISSYLGSIDLIKQFVKEYKAAIRYQNWGQYAVMSMKDVFDQCSAKCDKLGAWQIDNKSPKDLLWER